MHLVCRFRVGVVSWELEVESNETCIGESRSDRSIVLRVLTRTTCSWCSL